MTGLQRLGLYPHLAIIGIRKNRQLYLPYLATCVGMVFIFYILSSLAASPVVAKINGSASAILFLRLGARTIALFAGFFLLYTNSFLNRRRQKEMGLYHILGMNRAQLALILVWESVFTAAVVLVGGIILGALLYKLAELMMVRILHGTVVYQITVIRRVIPQSGALFGLIFLLLLALNLLRLWRSNPMELFRSEQQGEKPPRANLLFGLLGGVVLAMGYGTALTHQHLVTNNDMLSLVRAVGFVILGTYLLFVAGSVLLCRLLQRNKAYYYRTGPFVAVSSMVYRMKRNGGGLATICILLTMVLVMLTTGVGMLTGMESTLSSRYPMDYSQAVGQSMVLDQSFTQEEKQTFIDLYTDGLTVTESVSFEYLLLDACLQDNQLILEMMGLYEDPGFCELVVVDLSTWIALTDSSITLDDGAVLLAINGDSFSGNAVEIDGLGTLTIQQVMDMPDLLYSCTGGYYTAVVLVVSDLSVFTPVVQQGQSIWCYRMWRYLYNVAESDDQQLEWYNTFNISSIYALAVTVGGEDNYYTADSTCRVYGRSEYYGTYGGVIFLGAVLSAVFLLAAALIIYYKQISEGYEDAPRFAVMQKIGMTQQDIRASIRAQMRVVFLSPVVLAGIHMCFAFPTFRNLIRIFDLNDPVALILCAVGSFAAVAVLYTGMYLATSATYYRLVATGGE